MRIALTLVLILLTASTALAQPPKFELKGSLSWVLANGISFSGQQVDFPDGSSQIFRGFRKHPQIGYQHGTILTGSLPGSHLACQISQSA